MPYGRSTSAGLRERNAFTCFSMHLLPPVSRRNGIDETKLMVLAGGASTGSVIWHKHWCDNFAISGTMMVSTRSITRLDNENTKYLGPRAKLISRSGKHSWASLSQYDLTWVTREKLVFRTLIFYSPLSRVPYRRGQQRLVSHVKDIGKVW